MPTGVKPESSYGVLEQHTVTSDLDRGAEEIIWLGYSVIESGYSANEISDIGRMFDSAHKSYVKLYQEDFLRKIDEYNGIRMPLAFDNQFVDLAMNPRVLALVRKLIRNEFILNQQNGTINPPGETYNQGSWHRDLPYQHFLASKPLAISALYCVDEFTEENGATFVLPASHTQEAYPSDVFIKNMARQIVAPAGSFIAFNSMLFHRGGANGTSTRRRAVNHVYTTAFIKQQIDIPFVMANQRGLSSEATDLLGFRYKIPRSIADFLNSRVR